MLTQGILFLSVTSCLIHQEWDDFFDEEYTDLITGQKKGQEHLTGQNKKYYIAQCQFDDVHDYSHGQGGGAIFLEENVYSLFESCTFHDVSTNGNRGGAIHITQGQKIYIRNICADSCEITNSNDGWGSFIFSSATTDASYVTISSCSGKNAAYYISQPKDSADIMNITNCKGNQNAALYMGDSRTPISLQFSCFVNNIAQEKNAFYLKANARLEWVNFVNNNHGSWDTNAGIINFDNNNIIVKSSVFHFLNPTGNAIHIITISFIDCYFPQEIIESLRLSNTQTRMDPETIGLSFYNNNGYCITNEITPATTPPRPNE